MKRITVAELKARYKNKNFFKSDLFGETCPALFESDNHNTIKYLRRDGFVCVLTQPENTWHIFRKQ